LALSWDAFGASCVRAILLTLCWRKVTGLGTLSGMVVGAVTRIIWGSSDYLSGLLYQIVPGFLLSLIVTYVVSLLTYKENPEIEAEFDETLELLEKERK